MIAGVVESVVAVTPTERVKTALIDDAKSNVRKYTSGTQALASMIREQGFRELYRGLASATLKQSATSAVRMGSYNVIREWTKERNLHQNSAVTLASGAIAGIVTVYATQPFDSIKTMAQSARGASTGEAFQRILSEKGIRGFWGGSTMRLGRLVFSGAIVFTVYEKVISVLAPSPKI
ncbi:related to mitochondrial tricarboxylate/dicarboxylate carrier proteins [Cephalotrichum gorgonifer]|uniref:Related to mitochondrial tricarboxylate/dicarboxylate carrier proteins n=1 Tax=Cephalotrichum gorgonifer TaxID=2041049 RepID=A0AAE8N724_9PEZI|nr:related to mitochondrial tricarboxylate/dicarboxylate carrier proteins [Cephalotrichum gorgonifer]